MEYGSSLAIGRASSARDVVAQRLTGPDNVVRMEALDALGKLEPAALAEHAAAIVQLLADANKGVRGATQGSLHPEYSSFSSSDYTQTQGARSDYRAEAHGGTQHPVRMLGRKAEPNGALVASDGAARGQMRRSDSAGAEWGPPPSQKLFRTFSEPSQNLPRSHNLDEDHQILAPPRSSSQGVMLALLGQGRGGATDLHLMMDELNVKLGRTDAMVKEQREVN